MHDPVDQTFSPKDPREVIPLVFDFTALGTGFNQPEFFIEHYSGIADADPSAMKASDPTMIDDTFSIDVQGGVDGADYLVTGSVMKGTQKFIISGILNVRRAVGLYSQSEIID